MKRQIANIILLLFMLFPLAGCQRETVVKQGKDSKVELVDSIKYGFTEDMSYHKSYVQYITGESSDMMTFLEERTNTIYMFDSESGGLLDSIRLDVEGGRGVGRIQGYCFVNDDSIFTYQYGSGRCHLVNRHSDILRTLDLFDAQEHRKDTVHLFGSPYLETLTPMLKMADKLIVPTSFLAETDMETESNTTVIMNYDLESDSVSRHVPYPETYREHDWGGGFFYRMVNICKGLDGNSLVLSFPADSRLWEFNLSTHELTAHEAACNSIGTMKPFQEKKEHIGNHSNDAVEAWYYSQADYEGVFSDPYRKMYYRIGRLPVDEVPSGFNNKGVVIAAYDKDFNYLGESVLPDTEVYDTFNSYVSRKGLNIHLWRPVDEDTWTYYTYALKQ